jgi:small subunit ribosomal protein S20
LRHLELCYGSAHLLVGKDAQLANIKSQIKRNRQNEARRLRNRTTRSALKTYSRRVRESIAGGDREAAEAAYRRAARAFDRAVSSGVIHRNNAANHKSRLAKKLQSIG